MAQPKVIEGTWDEIAQHAEELRAYPRLTLIVPSATISASSLCRADRTPEERIRALNALAERNRELPVLPPEACERESLYAEDDTMTLSIELTVEEERRLRNVAAQHGVDLTQYARRALGLKTHPSVTIPLTEDEWDELEAELAHGIDPRMSPLSEQALSRASIYADRS